MKYFRNLSSAYGPIEKLVTIQHYRNSNRLAMFAEIEGEIYEFIEIEPISQNDADSVPIVIRCLVARQFIVKTSVNVT
jgi:hypothetical protein